MPCALKLAMFSPPDMGVDAKLFVLFADLFTLCTASDGLLFFVANTIYSKQLPSY